MDWVGDLNPRPKLIGTSFLATLDLHLKKSSYKKREGIAKIHLLPYFLHAP
jgi:hypothetical protein